MNYSQSDFFNILKAASPSYEKTAQVIASVLEISINEAYKKMRGKSALDNDVQRGLTGETDDEEDVGGDLAGNASGNA